VEVVESLLASQRHILDSNNLWFAGLWAGVGFGCRPRLYGRAGDAKAQKQKAEAFAQRVEQAHV
jgi:hypothetical protein